MIIFNYEDVYEKSHHEQRDSTFVVFVNLSSVAARRLYQQYKYCDLDSSL